MNEKLPLVVANHKANLKWQDVSNWVEEVVKGAADFAGTIVLCPTSPFIGAVAQKINEAKIQISVGIQDISAFPEGAYTGAVAASQIAGLCEFAIVGHSEEKKYFSETEEVSIKKLNMVLDAGITPILCVKDPDQLHQYVKLEPQIQNKSDQIVFVYEPPEAISGGGDYNAQDTEFANEQAKSFKEIIGKQILVIYGGSINPENAEAFFSSEHLSGGLVGQASLDPQKFIGILKAL